MDVELEDESEELRSGCLSYKERRAKARPVADPTAARTKTLLAERLRYVEPAELGQLRAVLRGPPSEQVVVEGFDIPMTRRLMHALAPSTWLNDEVINFYMCMLQARNASLVEHHTATGRVFRPSHFFNNFFVNKLLDNETGGFMYAYVKRWTRKFDVFSLDKVFCPINIHNTHWTMAVIFVQERRVQYFDSMGGAGRRYVDGLFRWLQEEHLDKKKTPLPDPASWTKVFGSSRGCPQQENGTDCGMFSLCCADFLSDDLPMEHDQESVARYWRQRVGCAILRRSLDYSIL